MRTLIVGEAPTAASDGLEAFDPVGGSGRRLAALLDVERVSEVAWTANLLDRPQAGAWPTLDARRSASELLVVFADVERLVLCGRRVAAAFGVSGDWLTWVALRDGRPAGLLPHPSGLSRWWNEPPRVEAAGRFLRSAVVDSLLALAS